jgi:hypothetical protein
MRVFILASIILAIASCNKKSKSKSFAGQVLNFAETTDAYFCNPDSIVISDCSGGDFYFSEEGNVFYNFSCSGQDSITYLIGNYTVTDNSIRSVFTKKYSYYLQGDSGDQVQPDPNSGQLKTIAPISFELKKLQCKKFNYGFISRGFAREKYVLKKSDADYSTGYLAKLKKIKAFDGM